jgi:hypothetical protein
VVIRTISSQDPFERPKILLHGPRRPICLRLRRYHVARFPVLQLDHLKTPEHIEAEIAVLGIQFFVFSREIIGSYLRLGGHSNKRASDGKDVFAEGSSGRRTCAD